MLLILSVCILKLIVMPFENTNFNQNCKILYRLEIMKLFHQLVLRHLCLNKCYFSNNWFLDTCGKCKILLIWESTNVYWTRRTYKKSTKLKKVKNVTIIFFLLVCVSINAFICDNNPLDWKKCLESQKIVNLFIYFCFDFKSPSRKWRRKLNERQINVTKWLTNLYIYFWPVSMIILSPLRTF